MSVRNFFETEYMVRLANWEYFIETFNSKKDGDRRPTYFKCAVTGANMKLI